MAPLILIVSAGLLCFYFQAACRKILRRQFTQQYFKSIVAANRFEFPAIRKAIEDLGPPLEYSYLTLALKCDFLGLTYLLKNAANVNQRYTREECLLILYFRVLFVSLVARHWLRRRHDSAVIGMTTILLYFANVVGERVNRVRFGKLTEFDFLNL